MYSKDFENNKKKSAAYFKSNNLKIPDTLKIAYSTFNIVNELDLLIEAKYFGRYFAFSVQNLPVCIIQN